MNKNNMEDSVAAEEEPGCFVRVTGISRETTEDALLNFFLNTRRSGGGEIKDSQFKLEEGVADITFMTSEVAERVVQKENIVLDGAKLNATLITIRKNLPTDKRSVHVTGISDRTTRDGLMTYMEVVSGEEVENVHFGDTCNAMVIFKDPPDFEKLSNMCSKKTLDGKIIQIEQVNMCDCIEVTGLSPKTTEDAVLYYFENSRNGGGIVRKLDYDKEAGRAVVCFDDPSVVDIVLMKIDHAIDDAHLAINRNYTLLGEISFTNPSGKKKDKVIEVIPNNMLLIKERFSQEFEQLLNDRQVKYTWQQGSGEIVLGCADPKMDKKTWENSCEAVVAYINQIVTEKIIVSQEAWKEMCKMAKEQCAVFENQISILHVFEFQTKENSIVLRGKKTDVSDLAKQLHDLISLVEEQIMIEKSKITKKIELSDVQIDLMCAIGFVDGLKTKHEGLEVTVIRDSTEQAIQLRGLEKQVNGCTSFIWQTLSKVKESEMKFSKAVVSILGSERGKAFMATNFKNNSIEAIISFDSSSDTHLMVTAVDGNHMNKAMEFIKNAKAEESIPLDKDQKKLIESEKWKELKLSIQQLTLLRLTEEPATNMLLLVGIKEEVDTAKKEIHRFFQDNVILNRVIDIGNGRAKFLFEYEMVSIQKIEESLKKNSVKVTKISDESVGTVMVSGTKEVIAQAVAEVDSLAKNVKDRILAIDKHLLRAEDEERNLLEFLDVVAAKRKFVFERFDELRGVVDICMEMSPNEDATKLKIQVFAVDDVTLQSIDDDIRAFEERKQVVNSITRQNHTRNESHLKVFPYYLFLGDTTVDSGRGKKEKVLNEDPHTMESINKFFRQEYVQVLQENRVKCTWQQGSGEIVLGCTDPKMDKKTWENSCEAVVAYIKQIVTETITVSQEAWKEICKKAKEKCESFRGQVAISCNMKERSFTLTGTESIVSALAEQLNDLNSEIQKQLEFEKNKISKSFFLTEAQRELFSLNGFVVDLEKKYKDLEVKLSKNDLTINVSGPEAVVIEGQNALCQTLSRVKEADLELPKSIVGIVGSQAGKVFMATKLKKEHIDAVVNCDSSSDNQLLVTAIDRNDAKKAADLIKDLTSEQSVPLDDHQKLIHSEKWKELKQSIQQSMLLQVREEPATSTLWIAGIKEEVNKAKENIDGFFEENIILEKVIDAENGRLKFILKYKKDSIQNMEKSLTNQSVKVVKKTDKDNEVSALVVSGTRDGMQQAVPRVQKLIDEIKDRKVDLDKPWMKKLFSQKKGVTLLSVVENDCNCIIDRCERYTPGSVYFIKVFATSDRNLIKAETAIHKLIIKISKTKEIEHKAVGKLSDSQRDRVMKMEVTHDVKIQIDKRINRIVIRGVAEDVANATVAVYDILNERVEEECTRRYAELLAKNVQWYYEDDDEWEPYDDETNAQIEQAFKDKKSAVVILLAEEDEDEPRRYKIDFSTSIERNLDTGETTRVERRKKTTGIPLPTHWDPQPKGSDGREVDLHMVVLDPVKHKKESDEVKGAMQKTIPGVNIIKVERVQNPGLYRTYVVKKQKMDDQNGSNEKKLFHGTASDTCQLIHHHGFNRYFCGKNASLYGKGVYFARDASYSAGYSPPDSAGNRYMYMASVLVGEYTKGNSDMITPPAKNPNNPTITYDTLVDNVSNPSIFVVFHDTQNYPDYLITFR